MMDFNNENGRSLKDSSDLSFYSNKSLYFLFCLVGILWGAFSWQGLVTVVNVWYGNEIFNHGFFIVPGALYLIYLKRYEVFSQPIKTAPIALVIVIPTLLVYVVGVAGKVQLLMHIATFVLLPCLIWFVIGTRAVTKILFPLCFMLFSIPVGEQLIPLLQEIAADGAVTLLRASGIPLFTSGLYIEIPKGRFLVAEACSGVSFFIASFVIGSLYSYLNLDSLHRKLIFVAISLILPIAANVLRVYGIILIAYFTDMEYAAGADHLIYGWFFFAFVILCLLGIGELLSTSKPKTYTQTKRLAHFEVNVPSFCILVFLIIFAGVWARIGASPVLQVKAQDNVKRLLEINHMCPKIGWSPLMHNYSLQYEGLLVNSDCNVKVVITYFDEEQGELVSDINRLFDPKQFSVDYFSNITIGAYNVPAVHIVSPFGIELTLIHWYVINGKLYTTDITAKLNQIFLQLTGKSSTGSKWVVAINERSDISLIEELIVQSLKK